MKNPVSVLVLVASLIASGCSATLMRTRPSDYNPHTATSPPDCETSNVAPVVDTGLAVVDAASALFLTRHADAADTEEGHQTAMVITSGLVVAALIETASAVWGFTMAKECRRAVAAYRAAR